MSQKLDTEERNDLSDSEFGLPEQRKFPLVDAAHIRAAEAYFRYATDAEKPTLARNIIRKAAQFGVDIKSHTILDWAKR